MKLLKPHPKLYFVVTWVLVCLASSFPRLLAQPSSRQPLNYTPPKGGRVPPPTTDSGTTRPGCPFVVKPLTPLVPKYYIGLTVFDRPTFLVFVPYSPTNQQLARFTLWNERENKVYETTFELPNQPGIVSFRLKENAPSLEVGKTYRWDFSFLCGEGRGFDSVQGWVKRVTLPDTLKSKLETATPRERIALYAANSLWYEALTELAQLRLKKPEDEAIEADWEDLLRDPDVRREQIVSEPISSCCTSNR